MLYLMVRKKEKVEHNTIFDFYNRVYKADNLFYLFVP